MPEPLLGFTTFLSIWHVDIAVIEAAYTLTWRERPVFPRKHSVHNLLRSTQQTYEIMMWRLFTRRVRSIILAQK